MSACPVCHSRNDPCQCDDARELKEEIEGLPQRVRDLETEIEGLKLALLEVAKWNNVPSRKDLPELSALRADRAELDDNPWKFF